MAIGKWIGGALGWILAGGNILGAVAGFCIGSMKLWIATTQTTLQEMASME